MEIGSGIAIGCSILGGVAVIFRIFKIFHIKKNDSPGNPKRKVRYEDTCEQIVKRIESTFKMLKESVDKGFVSTDKQLEAIWKKLNQG